MNEGCGGCACWNSAGGSGIWQGVVVVIEE